MESTNIKETKNALYVLRAQGKHVGRKNMFLKRLEKKGEIAIIVKGKELSDYLKRPILLNLPQYKNIRIISKPVIFDDRTLITLLQDNLNEIFELQRKLSTEKKVSSDLEGLLESRAEDYNIAIGKAKRYDEIIREKERSIPKLSFWNSIKKFFSW